MTADSGTPVTGGVSQPRGRHVAAHVAGDVRVPRLVATDLDGTLLRSDGTVSARTRAALAAADEAGIDVVFVTARPPRWVDSLIGAVGTHGIVICANGAAVYDVHAREVLAERGMSAELVTRLARELRAELPGIAFAVERQAGIGTESGFSGPHPLPPGSPVVTMVEETLTGATYKLLALRPGAEPDGFLRAVTRLIGDLAVLADSGASGLAEISGPGVTKAATLARWAASRGIGPHDVWAFGDAPNDLDMLAWAGTSFAVANAQPPVRAAATRACGANDDDGVAIEIERALDQLRACGGVRSR